MAKLVKVIADGLKLLGVSVKDGKFVAPNSKELEGKNLEALEEHFLTTMALNLKNIVDMGKMMIKDEFGRLA